MNQVASCLVFSLIALALSTPASADSISFSISYSKVTAAESAAGAPVDGDVYQFKVTTDGDILSINGIGVTLNGGAALYNNAFGDASDAEPGNPLLTPVSASLAVDSWITTPGATSLLGTKLPGDGVDTTYGDLTNDGAQQNFVFAQLTMPAGTAFTFTGAISIAGAGGTAVYTQRFLANQWGIVPVPVPEPASLGYSLGGLISLVAFRRR